MKHLLGVIAALISYRLHKLFWRLFGVSQRSVSDRNQGDAIVNIGSENKAIARCDIEILDVNGDFKEYKGRAAWIIISISPPAVADNGQNRDEQDMICLL